MPYSTAGLNLMVNGLTAVALRMALYTGDPGAAGTSNEASGGSPAYARKACTWAAASGGSAALSASVVFDVPAGTYTHVGFWNTAATVFYGSRTLTASVTAVGQNTVTITAGSVALTAGS